MCASTANRRPPSSSGLSTVFPIQQRGAASMASYKNPFKVLLPWCSASHEVARGDSPLFPDSPCLPRSASGAAACGRRLRPCRTDSSVFSSTANCRLSASAPPTFVPRIGRSPVRGFFSILSAISSGPSAVDSAKFFRMRSSTISTAKSFRMRSCKNALP